MNILILGGSGFLGSSCAMRLSKNNVVTIIDSHAPKQMMQEIDFELVSLSQTDDIISIIIKKKINVVMHFISSLLPSSETENFYSDIENVYIPSIKIIEFCADKGIAFVYFSSGGAVYGNQHEVFHENTKRQPVSLYGLSKLNFENTIAFYHNTRNLHYIIIRPSNPYGHGQNIRGKQGLIAIIIGKILDQQPIEIWGNGRAIKDYIYIDDFVNYVEYLLSDKHLWNATYNIGSGVGSSINEVIEAFVKNKIPMPEIRHVAQMKSDVSRMILDCTKIQQLFDFKCLDLCAGIKKFYDFELSRIQGTYK